jgi:hypothetical protein
MKVAMPAKRGKSLPEIGLYEVGLVVMNRVRIGVFAGSIDPMSSV